MLQQYMNDVAKVSTHTYDLDMATSFIYNFHKLSAEAVEGTCWEGLHKALPLSPLEIVKQAHIILQNEDAQTFAKLYAPAGDE